MAEQFPSITEKLDGFIARQHIFFVGTAATGTRVNVTPRSTVDLRITGPNEAMFLDRTGSSNETAAHMIADGRMTLMMCAVEGPPMILRLYGTGRMVRYDTPEFADLMAWHFAGADTHAARQIFIQDIDLVQTSCGFGVPMFEFQRERPSLVNWAGSKTEDDIRAYWAKKNAVSMDGLPTGLLDGDGVEA